jgi:tRNA(Arg) A34 adenosine deaminase TadA
MTSETFLRKALELAEEHSATGRNGPFGAVVVRDGVVVGEGWNRVVELGDPTAHAEVMAIRDACRHLGTHALADCVIYCSSEPCPMCLSAIYWARLPRLFFATSRDDAEAAGFDDSILFSEIGRDWDDRIVKGEQMMREEGLLVFRKWLENPDRVAY